MIKVKTVITIDDSFRSFIQQQNYEKYILTIINKSKLIFQNLRFSYIEDQAHGESDFVDNNGQSYDAKLIFDKKQGALIGDPRNDFNEWIEVMLKEKTEFGECIKKRDISFLETTRLYRIMKARLSTVKQDENAIFFIPFPVVDEFKGSSFLQLTTDFLQAVYNKLDENQLVNDRKLYFIYPSGDSNEYVLRDSGARREYIQCEELEGFIRFQSEIVIEE